MPSLAEEACGGSKKETAAATNVKTAGEETDIKVRQRENMHRGNERRMRGRGKRVWGKGRDKQERC